MTSIGLRKLPAAVLIIFRQLFWIFFLNLGNYFWKCLKFRLESPENLRNLGRKKFRSNFLDGFICLNHRYAQLPEIEVWLPDLFVEKPWKVDLAYGSRLQIPKQCGFIDKIFISVSGNSKFRKKEYSPVLL